MKQKDVKRLIIENNTDILYSQETKIQLNYPVELLTFGGYKNENEKNHVKSRCGIFVKNNISYVRRTDLEIKNMHFIIIDIDNVKKLRF